MIVERGSLFLFCRGGLEMGSGLLCKSLGWNLGVLVGIIWFFGCFSCVFWERRIICIFYRILGFFGSNGFRCF